MLDVTNSANAAVAARPGFPSHQDRRRPRKPALQKVEFYGFHRVSGGLSAANHSVSVFRKKKTHAGPKADGA